MDAFAFQQLLAENQRLREQNARFEQIIRDQQKRIDELERAAKRQAAPFSKGPPKEKPKKPGRKKGKAHGKHGHRDAPKPAQVDETLEAPLPDQCPDCGGDVVEDPDRLDQQFQTEIPRQPIVRQFNIHCGHCAQCGKHLRGHHALQTSDATGAAQSQLGPDAQAAVVYLNKRAGMSHGKIADTFDKFFGISISRGACAQIVLRAGRKLEPVYAQIKEHLKTAEHITPDETGWRVGGRLVWLHGWVGDDGTTCYVIDPQRGADALAKVIGWDWSGTMTHDGCPSYDRFLDAGHQQCVDHATRRARALAEKQTGAAKAFPNQVINLFGTAFHARDEYRAGKFDQADLVKTYERCVATLLDLTEKPRTNELNETFAKHLHHHGEQWFQFLLNPTIPATNHRAEQALKTPIVNRKVWGGNRTEAGAKAQEITSSVLQTCKNKAVDAFTYISNACCNVLVNLLT
jgi:transposase